MRALASVRIAEHTDEVLKSVGCMDAQIDTLVATGAVKVASA